MQKLNLNDIYQYVQENIGTFHQKRIQSLNTLQLGQVLKRKNPYLFKAKNMLTADQIINGLVEAHISSNEETLFGDWLEGLAIYINGLVYNGHKSGIKGIDLEFDSNGKRNIVSIKSGPNWGNSSQIEKMKSDFRSATKTLRTSHSDIVVFPVNGCCYGRDDHPDKGEYFKLCGQRFWEFISNNSELYIEIIEPLGFKAKERNEEFQTLYAQRINIFAREFLGEFCLSNGNIDWGKLVKFNSSKID